MAKGAPCHGNEGAGDGPDATWLGPKVGSFRDRAMVAEMSDVYWFWRVSEGGLAEPYQSKGSIMPGLQGRDVRGGPLGRDRLSARAVRTRRAAYRERASGDGRRTPASPGATRRRFQQPVGDARPPLAAARAVEVGGEHELPEIYREFNGIDFGPRTSPRRSSARRIPRPLAFVVAGMSGKHARSHSVVARFHPWAMWSAMQASCCDQGFRPRALARHVAVSPVRGFCIITSVAQPANKHAAATSNGRYRKGIASFKLVADRLPARVVRWCPHSSALTCVSVAPTADRWVEWPRHPVGSTSPHPGPGRALPCRRSGWPGPALA